MGKMRIGRGKPRQVNMLRVEEPNILPLESIYTQTENNSTIQIQYIEVPKEIIKEVPVEREVIIEKPIEVEKIIYQTIEVPVERIVEKPVEYLVEKEIKVYDIESTLEQKKIVRKLEKENSRLKLLCFGLLVFSLILGVRYG